MKRAPEHGIYDVGWDGAGWTWECFCGQGGHRRQERWAPRDAAAHVTATVLDATRRRHDPDRDPLGFARAMRRELSGELGAVLDVVDELGRRTQHPQAA